MKVSSAQFRMRYPDGRAVYATAHIPCTIGRRSGHAIQILHPDVSKAHLRIDIQDGLIVLEDLNSANGTTLNGHRITQSEIQTGDEIVLGEQVTLDVLSLPRLKVLREGQSTILGEGTILEHVPKRRHEQQRDYAQHIVSEISKSNDDGRPERVAYQMLDRLQTYLFFDRASLYLKDDEGELECVATRGRVGVPAVFPASVQKQVDRTNRGVLTHDARQDAALKSNMSIIDLDARSSIAVPIRIHQEILGYIYILSVGTRFDYQSHDVQQLETIAATLALVLENMMLRQQIQKEIRLEEALSKFLPPALIVALKSQSKNSKNTLEKKLDLLQRTQKLNATVMFVDIRNFTELASSFPAEDVVRWLNEYYDAIVELVFRFGGSIDKLMGDGLMAVWGVAQDTEQHAFEATSAAHAIIALVQGRTPPFFEGTGQPIHVGVGIATGNLISAIIGGSARQDHTVLGHTVNVASRLCDAASANEILLASTTGKLLPNQCRLRPKGEVSMKGLGPAVRVYALDTIQTGELAG